MNSPGAPTALTSPASAKKRKNPGTPDAPKSPQAASSAWCAAHIVSKTLSTYRRAVAPSLKLESVLLDYAKNLGLDRASQMLFFAHDHEVSGETLVKDLPQVAPRMIVLQAIPPHEAACVRVAARLAKQASFFSQAAPDGALTQEKFCAALASLDIPGCEPSNVWALSMGAQESVDHVQFLAHFSAFERVKSTALRRSADDSSDVVLQIQQGCTVVSLSEPIQVGEKLVGEIDCQGKKGFACFQAADQIFLQRTFEFCEPKAEALPTEDDAAVAAEDRAIDDDLGIQVRDEEDGPEDSPPTKGRGKAKPKQRGRPRVAKSRLALVEKDIQRLQSSTKLLVPKANFGRVVKDVLEGAQKEREKLEHIGPAPAEAHFRMTADALKVLQEAAEQHVTQEFGKLRLLAAHRKAVTIELRDLQTLTRLRS